MFGMNKSEVEKNDCSVLPTLYLTNAKKPITLCRPTLQKLIVI